MMGTGAPLAVLIVEDEALLAMDIAATIEDCGHEVVGEAASLSDVDAMQDIRPDLALIDLHLAHGSSGIDVARLVRTRWPSSLVVFVTANPRKIPEDFAGGHGVIPKPFSRDGLIAALRYIEEARDDRQPLSPPNSFTPSPQLSIRSSAFSAR
ncbi:response regulator [Sphingomonas sp. Root710]|uniref:response regulator n=1 Tax=Sphingomonas sp. Root710 TaxID=1736594 RepID=UPI0006FBF886|nr:response regulator [Sphingomonas sp. Root710]KRB85393.1 response regulator [Sphingomonas sp. Root710]